MRKIDKEYVMQRIAAIVGINGMCKIKILLSILSHPILKIKNVIRINQLAKDCEIINEKIWKRIFIKAVISSNEERVIKMIEHFYTDKLVLVKESSNNTDEVIVVCTVKNDIVRIQKFIDYYRDLNVRKFIIIDNGSTDGTKEYLETCMDVTLYQCFCTFSSTAKAAWNNIAIAREGLEKWYLIADSDELFAFPEMEEIDINQYVNILYTKSIFAVKAIMLEMYPKGKLLDEEMQADNFLNTHCYFDGDPNAYVYDSLLGTYSGGFHERLFECGKTTRTKRPLVYYDGKRVAIGAHDIFPLYENITSKTGAALLHYKFIPGDRSKIKQIIKDGNYANGSRLYKLYDKKISQEEFSAYYEGSVEWKNVNSIKCLPFIKRISGEVDT